MRSLNSTTHIRDSIQSIVRAIDHHNLHTYIHILYTHITRGYRHRTPTVKFNDYE